MKTSMPVFRCRKCGSKALVTFSVPNTFVSNCARKSSTLRSSQVPTWINAALLTRTSIWPWIEIASAILPSIISWLSVTSSWRIEAPVLQRCCRRERLRPVAMTLSPRATIECTNCSPKPEEQPVISQTSWGGILSDCRRSVEVEKLGCMSFGKEIDERLC